MKKIAYALVLTLLFSIIGLREAYAAIIPDTSCFVPAAAAEGDKITSFGTSIDAGTPPPSLQYVLDSAGYSVHTNTDETGYQYWDVNPHTTSLSMAVKFVKRYAQYDMVFGYYNGTGDFTAVFNDATTPEGTITNFTINNPTTIRFAIRPTTGAPYSTRNSYNQGGEDHAVVYSTASSRYIVAFEDRSLAVSDRDYQDFISEIAVVGCSQSSTPDLVASLPNETTAIVNTPKSFVSTITNSGNMSTVSSFSNFFQILPPGVSTPIDLSPTVMSALASNGSAAATSPAYTFATPGTYQVRACADKTNSGSAGTIDEGADEGNNCSAWRNVSVFNSTGPAGTISSSSCQISAGQYRCDSNVTYSTANLNTTATTEVTRNNSSTAHVSYDTSGTRVVNVAYGVTTFFLYHDSALLSQSDATASCVAGTTWDGSQCATSASSSLACGSDDTAFITGKSLGTVRNDYSGWVGFQFTTGNTPLSIRALGRIMGPSNRETHTVKLVKQSTGADVSGGTLTISMSGGTVGEFKYENLPSPVTLAANTTYYLVSSEVNGGDQWYDNNTALSTTGDASINSAVRRIDSWVSSGSAGHSYVPVDMCIYSGALSGTLIPDSPACTIRSGQSTCDVTLDWTTAHPIGISAVTAEGMDDVNGNAGSHDFPVPYSSRTFYLYNNNILLAQTTATSQCEFGNVWNSVAQVCSPIANPSPTVTLGADPDIIAPGESSKIKWMSTNANYCTASFFSGQGPVVNSIGVTVSPTVTTSYTIQCANSTTQAIDQKTVTVGVGTETKKPKFSDN